MPRYYTKKIMEMVDEGLLGPKEVMNMCLRAMSEDDVADMFKAEMLDENDDEDEEDSE